MQLAHYTDFSPQPTTEECIDSNLVEYSFLKDRIHDYIRSSYCNGIGILSKTKEINSFVKKGELVELKSNKFYIVDTMRYGYPYLTPRAVSLLDSIGKHFQKSFKNTTLEGVKFHLTSALRTTRSIKRLKRTNGNASKFSAHLHGTTFDIGYDEFVTPKKLSDSELLHLKETLASTLSYLKHQELCWVTYEVHQSCFHVVSK